MTNPFPNDLDRSAIWMMLVDRDIAAFVAADWSLVAGDFVEFQFLGIDGKGADNPDGWRIGFPSLADYRDEWLRQARESQETAYSEDRATAIHRATTLTQIEIKGDVALAHKKFDGSIARADGGKDVLNWQTLYFCRKVAGVWKLIGFAGYLPYPMGESGERLKNTVSGSDADWLAGGAKIPAQGPTVTAQDRPGREAGVAALAEGFGGKRHLIGRSGCPTA